MVHHHISKNHNDQHSFLSHHEMYIHWMPSSPSWNVFSTCFASYLRCHHNSRRCCYSSNFQLHFHQHGSLCCDSNALLDFCTYCVILFEIIIATITMLTPPYHRCHDGQRSEISLPSPSKILFFLSFTSWSSLFGCPTSDGTWIMSATLFAAA